MLFTKPLIKCAFIFCYQSYYSSDYIDLSINIWIGYSGISISIMCKRNTRTRKISEKLSKSGLSLYFSCTYHYMYILCIQLTSIIKCFSHKERLCATSDQLSGYKAKENYPQHFSRFLKALPSPSTSYMYFCFSYRNMVPDI